MSTRAAIHVRVRYAECDPMNVAHHSVYPVWMEVARTQLLRQQGTAYADCEKAGIYFVVAKLNIRYRRPAHYDDELTIEVEAIKSAGVKIEHTYTFRRGNQLIAKADTTLACVDRAGKLRPVPKSLLM